jgi:hypothetical protein
MHPAKACHAHSPSGQSHRQLQTLALHHLTLPPWPWLTGPPYQTLPKVAPRDQLSGELQVESGTQDRERVQIMAIRRRETERQRQRKPRQHASLCNRGQLVKEARPGQPTVQGRTGHKSNTKSQTKHPVKAVLPPLLLSYLSTGRIRATCPGPCSSPPKTAKLT